jgi:hypothetical protein
MVRFGLTDLDFCSSMPYTVIMQNQLSISLFCADVFGLETQNHNLCGELHLCKCCCHLTQFPAPMLEAILDPSPCGGAGPNTERGVIYIFQYPKIST